MRFILIILLSLSMQAGAACIEKLVKSEHVVCVKQAKEFADINSLLCANNNRDFSAQYQTYLNHKVDWSKAFEKWKVATSSSEKDYQKTKMDSIQRDWRLFGYRDEVDLALAVLDSLASVCARK